MCDPLTIAGIALSVGGVAANSIASGQVERANSRALEAERFRQQGLRREASALQEASRQRYDNVEAQQGQRAEELGSYLNAQRVPSEASGPTAEAPVTGSNITVQEEANQRARAGDFSQGQAEALGNMRSFGDLLGTLNRGQARDAGQIGQIGGFMRGSSNVLPIELEAASHAGDGMRSLGSLASGLGQVGLSAGLNGGFGGTAPTTAAAATGGLPSLATGSAPGTFDLGSALSAMPQAPMRVGTQSASLPSFARSGNLYSVF